MKAKVLSSHSPQRRALAQKPGLLAERLDSGRVRLADFGANAGVRTPVVPIPGARVMWLNTRWFMAQSIDLADAAVRSQVERLLLVRYAVQVTGKSTTDAGSSYVADRYGQTGGTTFGGSGRCLTFGGFNVKGVGATALVPVDADWFHSHGFVWHEEAVREAIVSELMNAEAPGGAAAIIALLDTGLCLQHGNGTTGAPRALVVREGFVRLGHLERSVFFGTAGDRSSDQYADALRVAEYAATLFGRKPDPRDELQVMVDNAARHVAFTVAARLWPGGFLSSNVAIDGALVDFGGFRSLPDWRPYIGDPKLPHFGADFAALRATAHSLAYTFGKHLRRDPGLDGLLAAIRARESAMFPDLLADFSSGQDEVAQATVARLGTSLESTVQAQQYAGFDGDSSARLATPALDSSAPIVVSCDPLHVDLPAVDLAALRRAERHLSQRPFLDREALLALVEQHLAPAGGTSSAVDELIQLAVSNSRRIWRRLPGHLIVHAQCSGASWSLLKCSLDGRVADIIWAEGQIVAEEVEVAGFRLRLDELITGHRALVIDDHCQFLVSVDGGPDAIFRLSILDHPVYRLADIVYVYGPDPDNVPTVVRGTERRRTVARKDPSAGQGSL